MDEIALARPRDLPVGPTGRRGLGSWGVGTLIASEAALFVYLLFSYFYVGASSPRGWLLEPAPSLKLALPNTIILLVSSFAAWFGERGVLQRRRGEAVVGFAVALILGIIFAVIQWFEWHAKPFGFGQSSYASLYFVTTGFHMAHVLVGLAVLAAIVLWTALDYFSP